MSSLICLMTRMMSNRRAAGSESISSSDSKTSFRTKSQNSLGTPSHSKETKSLSSVNVRNPSFVVNPGLLDSWLSCSQMFVVNVMKDLWLHAISFQHITNIGSGQISVLIVRPAFWGKQRAVSGNNGPSENSKPWRKQISGSTWLIWLFSRELDAAESAHCELRYPTLSTSACSTVVNFKRLTLSACARRTINVAVFLKLIFTFTSHLKRH